jgi:hypothetical protein
MEIGLSILRKVKVDNDIDSLNVDTTGKEIRTDKIATDSITEVVEDTIPVRLKHASVAVEAGVAKLGDLLG